MTHIRVTSRGFQCITFVDANGELCSIQQSSAIGDTPDAADRPGSSMLWLGAGENRMHLDRGMVVALIAELQEWVDNGKWEDRG